VRETVLRAKPLAPWLAAIIAFAAGAVSVMAYAPLHIWPLFAASLSALVFLLDDATRTKRPLRAGFWRGWLFGFGAFLAGLNWIANAFLVDIAKFGALAIPAVLALPAFLALFWGIAGTVCMALWSNNVARIAVFSAAFALVEWLRATILTGFPWNLPGYIWPAGGSISQIASVIGIHGLSILTLVLLVSPALWIGVDKRTHKIAYSAIALTILGAIYAFGAVRLAHSNTSPDLKAPMIAVVDAGFTQREKWLPENRDRVAKRYIDLLDEAAAKKANIIVWPEGATPFPLLEDAATLQGIDEKLGTRQLATGLVRRETLGVNNELYFNSLAVIGRDARGLSLRGLYDKNHLVPFGEYVPFGALFDALGLRSLVSYGSDFTPGAAITPITFSGAPKAWPLICYEAIFPIDLPAGADRPGWLLNVSVDAWFGNSQGPAQHFNQARYRAIETGLPLVRAASGGPSGIVDPYGRIIVLGAKNGGVTANALPSALAPTVQSRNEYFFWGVLVLFFVVGGLKRFREAS
jgi:apolipoprotein N-acyltransferase